MPDLDPAVDYPLGERRPDLVKAPSGASLAELSFENLRQGFLAGEDVRATADTLALQAQIARSVGRPQLAANLLRASELTRVPDDVMLALYRALRPGRSTSSGLEDWATTLEQEYAAPTVAAFVREASSVYRSQGLLR